MPRDRWAEWVLSRRFGGERPPDLGPLAQVRDRVLDRASLQEGETLLDVGCGDGLIAFGALERGAGRVVFSDVSQDLLDVSRELAADDPRCEFVRAAAEDLEPVGDASVDVVTTRSVIIYVTDKRRAFAEFFRVLRDGGRLSMFEPINRFSFPEPEGRFLGIDMGDAWPLARRVRERYDELSGGDGAMLDFDERDLLELAHDAGFASAQVELEAAIEQGRLWGREPPPLDKLLRSAPNPNAPTFQELLDAELSAQEQAQLLAHLRPRYESGALTSRHAVAYLRAEKTSATPTPWPET